MTDRLELLLRAAASATEYPSTPELTGRVLSRLSSAEVPSRRGLKPAFSWALVAAILLWLIALAVSPSREAIARFFGIEGSKIERLPAPPPGVTPTPFPAPSRPQSFASPVRLADLSGLAGFQVGLPSTAGPPEEAYLLAYGSQRVAILHYERFDIWQAQLKPEAFFSKTAPSEVSVRQVAVNGLPGSWLAGGSHIVRFVDSSGREIAGSDRVVNRNTLIWRTARAFYRIETDLPLDQALRIAETLP